MYDHYDISEIEFETRQNAHKVPLYKYEKSQNVVKRLKWLEFRIDMEMVGVWIMGLVSLGLIGFLLWHAVAGMVLLYVAGNPWFWWISGALVTGALYVAGRIVLYQHNKVIAQARSYGTIDE